MDQQFKESESIRVKSLETLNHYEFGESEILSNDDKVLNKKEKKQKEDEKFNMFVKMHDIMKYGKQGKLSIREDSYSQERKKN